jgi:hypothetical protein
MPTILIPKPGGVPSPVDDPPVTPSASFIKLGDGEVYFHNGSAWVGLNGARTICDVEPDVVEGSAVVVTEGTARLASATQDKACSGIVTHITPGGLGVVTAAGRIARTSTNGSKYFLGLDGALTATPNPDTQHIVLIGTGEGDTLLLTLGVSSEAPI